jgi:hypothetical protein
MLGEAMKKIVAQRKRSEGGRVDRLKQIAETLDLLAHEELDFVSGSGSGSKGENHAVVDGGNIEVNFGGEDFGGGEFGGD